MYDRVERRNRIERFTQFIRTRLALSSPLNMLSVCQQLDVQCVSVSNADYDARIFFDEEQNKVFINYAQNRVPERIQFSVAHELGHLFLHMLRKDGSIDKRREYYRKNNDPNQIEHEANAFAASLLMPREEFFSICLVNLDSENNIYLDKVAKHFGVSQQAANVRGSVLGIW